MKVALRESNTVKENGINAVRIHYNISECINEFNLANMKLG